MRYFHVSPTNNDDPITRQGVDPHKSAGRLESSWWVGEERILWAIAHVSARHQVSVDEISIWVCDGEHIGDDMIKTRLPGVYHCKIIVGAEYRSPATVYVSREVYLFTRPDSPAPEEFAPPPENIADIPF